MSTMTPSRARELAHILEAVIPQDDPDAAALVSEIAATLREVPELLTRQQRDADLISCLTRQIREMETRPRVHP